MIDPSSVAYGQLEATILKEIREITARIQELQRQKETYEQLLVRTRERNDLVRRSDVTRKNSINRVLAEGAILQTLQNAKREVPAKNLIISARLMVPTLPEGTFRSYLFRMKDRGLIESVRSGMWRLSNKKAA